MEVRIRSTDGDSGDLMALREWLDAEDDLRGRVRTAHAPIGDTDLGALPELLTIAVGAGGMGSVLASSLKTWLLARRTSAKLTVEANGRSINLDITTTDDVIPLLAQIINAPNDD
ncbi:hypothetical protein Psi02_76060 [Planotetraspora silvatica]|uniref:Uncharacterized protein n=1 Tax=Planotetraspora silvatica TaxID=234614 RepID=A0A8J3UTS1_9ACTN|nr:hypothetical protein [Planotetraspora silvatica]GII51182.1 hypothetical protein Psi02_76060 [Planotetraspora silvatica]